MTLNDLLSRYTTNRNDPVDIFVDDPSAGRLYFLPGVDGHIPAKIRDREVSYFAVDMTKLNTGGSVPSLGVTLKEVG